MSSIYQPICVSHDPAIVIDIGAGWQSRGEAIERLEDVNDDETLRAHADCDLLIGRYCYPLVELICPAGRTKNKCRDHDVTVAMDAHWLRLLAAAMFVGDTYPRVKAAVEAFDRGCWTRQRMLRLAPLLF